MSDRKMLDAVVDKMIEGDRFCSVESFPGKLRMICGGGQNGPATNVTLLWETYDAEDERIQMVISVDLVVVAELEIEIDAFLLDRVDIFHQHFYDKLKATKKFHLLGTHFKPGLCRISFALTELQLTRDKSETHKTCYNLLKYICRTHDSFYDMFCSSFMLKNLVLHSDNSDTHRGEVFGTCRLITETLCLSSLRF